MPPTPDYFWLIDADELWDASDIRRAFEFLSKKLHRYVQTRAQPYFKTWNHRMTGYEWFTTFVRADRRLHSQRNPYALHQWTKAPWRVPGVSPNVPLWSAGVRRLDPGTAWFHHGSYVGPRARFEAKVAWSPHAHQMAEGSLEEAWDNFSTSATDFHPTIPSAFVAAEYVPTAELPPCIRDQPWPDGYIE